MTKPIKIALYLRLSYEDKEKGESESISNQREMLNAFVGEQKEFKGAVVTEFVDDGYSGTNFDRPKIKELLLLVERKQVDCIIVKDFSRLGRNYIEVDYFIEEFFPLNNVRFISVNNNYDSFKNPFGLDVALINLINDIYAKDNSLKIKSSIKARQERGIVSRNSVCYGYYFSENGKLEVDVEAGKVVKFIFDMAYKDFNSAQIARELNRLKYSPPKFYFKTRNIKNCDDVEKIWLPATVGKMLKNETYVGNIILHKSERYVVGRNLRKKMDKDKTYIFQNSHEPLVSKMVFERVNRVKRKGTEHGKKAEKSLFYGKLYCKECDKPLYICNRGGKAYYYCERSRVKMDARCKNVKMFKADLEKALITEMNLLISSFCDGGKIKKVRKVEKVLDRRAMEMGISEGEKKKIKLYEKFSLKEMSREAYFEEKALVELEISKLTADLMEWDEGENRESGRGVLDEPVVRQHICELTKEVLEVFVERVYVEVNNDVEVVFNFREVFGVRGF